MNRIYTDNLEVDSIIEAVQPELDAQSESIQSYFDDTFPKAATAAGILKWEIILGIVANPSTEIFNFRRERILNRLASNMPYTERALHQVMDNIMGPGGWSYELDYRGYTLDITSLLPGRNWLNEMKITLDKIIPANLIYNLYIYYANWERVRDDFEGWNEIYAANKTWQDVMEGI